MVVLLCTPSQQNEPLNSWPLRLSIFLSLGAIHSLLNELSIQFSIEELLFFSLIRSSSLYIKEISPVSVIHHLYHCYDCPWAQEGSLPWLHSGLLWMCTTPRWGVCSTKGVLILLDHSMCTEDSGISCSNSTKSITRFLSQVHPPESGLCCWCA